MAAGDGDEGLSMVRGWLCSLLGSWICSEGEFGEIAGVFLGAAPGGQVVESAWASAHVGANRRPLI